MPSCSFSSPITRTSLARILWFTRIFLSMAYTSKQREETNAKHNKAAALFQTGFSWFSGTVGEIGDAPRISCTAEIRGASPISDGPERAIKKGMNFYDRLIAMHGE